VCFAQATDILCNAVPEIQDLFNHDIYRLLYWVSKTVMDEVSHTPGIG
jgi:hypothetical protein